MDTADVLEKAALVIEERGWHQGDWCPLDFRTGHYEITGPVCVRGAINVVVGGSPLSFDAPGVREAAQVLEGFLGSSASVWQDWSCRTAPEVTAALRDCAASLRGAS